MITRYCLLLTIKELEKLSDSTKRELANLDPEFANMLGIPTPDAPAPQPANPRPVATMPDGTKVLLPEKNQTNQQDSPHYTQWAGGGIPGMPPAQTAPPANVVVPMTIPPNTGIPPAPSTPAPMVPSPVQWGSIPGMPGASQSNGAAQQAPQQPAFNPTQQAPQQPAFNPAPQQTQQELTPDFVRHQFIPQKLAEMGPQNVLQLVAKAHSQGILERESLDCLNHGNVRQFVELFLKG